MTDSQHEDTRPVINMSLRDNHTANEQAFFDQIGPYWQTSGGTHVDRLCAFPRFVPRQTLATFLTRERIFSQILRVHGHIIECGVFRGAGLFAWSQLSAILEPYNHVRRIVGFDTFEGFPDVGEHDGQDDLPYKHAGGLATGALEEITQGLQLHDLNRPLGHMPRTELVEGDATKTIPQYVDDNKHLVVALLYLDFDLYEPTKIAIETFWPRMPKGSVIAFDELNQTQWPGETMALLETIGIGAVRLQRFEFNPQICFAVKE